MEQRIRRNTALKSIVSKFETNFENGYVDYIDEATYTQLIGFYESEKAYEKALDVTDLALNQYEYRSDFYIAKSRLLLRLNAITESLKYIDKANSIAPYQNEITILRAKALAQSGQFIEAFEYIDQLKEDGLSDKYVDIHLCESDIYLEMNELDKRYNSLKQALQIDPYHVEAHEKFWSTSELCRRYMDCVTVMEALLNADPYNHLAWYNLGQAHSFLGEYEKAIDAMEFSFTIDEDFENGYLDCAELCTQIKDFEKAQKIYEEALTKFGDDNDVIIHVAECQLYLNKVDASKANLLKAIKQDPYNDQIFFLLGECYSKEEKWFSAVNAYHKGIDIDDNVGEYYLGLARAYVALEDYNKATVNFHLAVSDGPEQTHYWVEFSSFLLKMGLFKEALRILDEAEDFSYGADLLYCRAISLYFLDEKEEAIRFLKEGLMEDYSLYTMIYSLAPELQVDKEISSMIRYYAGEF